MVYQKNTSANHHQHLQTTLNKFTHTHAHTLRLCELCMLVRMSILLQSTVIEIHLLPDFIAKHMRERTEHARMRRVVLIALFISTPVIVIHYIEM